MCKRDEHTQYKSGEAIPFNYTVTGAGPQSQVTTYSEEGQVGWNKIPTFTGFFYGCAKLQYWKTYTGMMQEVQRYKVSACEGFQRGNICPYY